MFGLKVRSYFSLMRGTASPLALCQRAKALGYNHLALTDLNNLYGLPAFLRACKETGIQPIIGAEISQPKSASLRLCCLVTSSDGYSNLCTLLTRRHCDPSFSLQSIPQNLGSGLVFLSTSEELLAQLKDKNFHIAADLGNKATGDARQLRTWARKHQIPAIATLSSSILHEEDELLYTLLRAIEDNKTLSTVTIDSPPHPLLSYEQLRQNFDIWPEVIVASTQLGMQCLFRGPNFGIVMPPWHAGKNNTPSQVLRIQAYKGAQLRYGEDLSEVVVDRLEYELKIIDDMGFSSYFLIVRDIVHPIGKDKTRTKRRICGRGSGAASLVAYCLEITNVCPVRHNLYFERFLNPGRQDPPDIDIDFAWDERDQVLEYVLEKFKGHAALVCNHVYFQPRMAIRETAKAFGIPGGEISELTKKTHLHFKSGSTKSLEDTISDAPTCRGQDIDGIWSETLSLAEKLIGIPRYLSVHPGGVIITPRKIEQYVPIEIASKGVPIIHWEKDGAEDSGLIKIDILGNRSLGVIRDAIKNIHKNGTQHDEYNWLPEDDQQTQQAIAQGATMGCFYIESPAMRLLQQKARTGDFEQLVLQSSIIRPAANDFVREYVRRLHGGDWKHLHPSLSSVLDETFGLMVYQEDVSKVAVALANFSHAQADGLRKVLSKKDRELRLKNYKDEFYEGCCKNGIAQEVIDSLWAMILSFDGYSFCKPHSASYAKVSFQAAYLKVHYPAEFMAAVISNQGGFYSTFAYVSEAKRLGLTVLLPDINKSLHHWQGVAKTIRTGFLSVKSLSYEMIKKLLCERDKKTFCNPTDFFYRVHPSEEEGRALIHAGALDSLQSKTSREELLWEFAAFKKLTNQRKTAGLFEPRLPPPPQLPQQSERERLRYEYKYLGFLCSTHPICLFKSKTGGLKKAKDMATSVGKNITLAGWLLTGKVVSTKSGEAMEFLTFEDETASFETTFFPYVYRRYAHLLEAGRGYVLQGLVDEDFGVRTLTVNSVCPIG